MYILSSPNSWNLGSFTTECVACNDNCEAMHRHRLKWTFWSSICTPKVEQHHPLVFSTEAGPGLRDFPLMSYSERANLISHVFPWVKWYDFGTYFGCRDFKCLVKAKLHVILVCIIGYRWPLILPSLKPSKKYIPKRDYEEENAVIIPSVP